LLISEEAESLPPHGRRDTGKEAPRIVIVSRELTIGVPAGADGGVDVPGCCWFTCPPGWLVVSSLRFPLQPANTNSPTNTTAKTAKKPFFLIVYLLKI
jgi:hypothetical protein